jgi:putative photosynthetic complex assembly protein 2
VRSAYLGFTCGVLVWGWHEMSFFMGVVTGPRRAAGPPTTGWRHFCHAAQTCLYHEAAIALTAALVVALSWGSPSPIGAATFLSLWAMRLSAKLNIFFGVRNLNEAWIPRRLTYLLPYMRHRAMNWLLPFSLLGGTAACAWFTRLAIAPAALPADVTGKALVAGILFLAVIEHAFMVLPLPFASLWRSFLSTCPVTTDRPATAPATLAPALVTERR